MARVPVPPDNATARCVGRRRRVRFAQIPEALLRDAEVSHGAVRLWGILDRHVGENESTWVGIARLAEELVTTDRTVQRWLRELEARGWLTRTPRKRGNGATSTADTVLNDDPQNDADVTSTPVSPVSPAYLKESQSLNESQDSKTTATHTDSSTSKSSTTVTDPPASVTRAEAQQVFDTWRQSTGKARATLSPQRVALLGRRVRDGFSLKDLEAAARGVALSDWNMGRDPKTEGKTYNDFELVFRDAGHVERFIAYDEGTAEVTPAPREYRARQGGANGNDLRRAAAAIREGRLIGGPNGAS